MIIEEVWKYVKGSNRYMVSNLGRVKTLSHISNNRVFPEKILNIRLDKDGYPRVNLSIDVGISKTRHTYSLVAEAFLENPENKKQINHKDGNKLNSYVENLEWCTQSENMKHSYNVLNNKVWLAFTDDDEKNTIIKNKIKNNINCREVMCVETGEKFYSSAEAGRIKNLSSSIIYKCCTGKTNSYNNFHWKFTDEKVYVRIKKIICLTNNTVYNSCKEASELLKISRSSIQDNIKKRTKTCHGLSFEYYNEDLHLI